MLNFIKLTVIAIIMIYGIYHLINILEGIWWDSFVTKILSNPISCPNDRLIKLREEAVKLQPPLEGTGTITSYAAADTKSYYAKVTNPKTMEVLWFGGKVPIRLQILFSLLNLFQGRI